MTRSLAISQRQTQSLLRAAEAERAIIEVQMGATVIRLIPKCHALPSVQPNFSSEPVDEAPSPESFKTLEEYLAWSEGHACEN